MGGPGGKGACPANVSMYNALATATAINLTTTSRADFEIIECIYDERPASPRKLL